jgi:hypothetical protein
MHAKMKSRESPLAGRGINGRDFADVSARRSLQRGRTLNTDWVTEDIETGQPVSRRGFVLLSVFGQGWREYG